MSSKTAILDTEPTSYWPLDDVTGTSCHDEMGLHDALASSTGVKLAAVPFGAASAPYFDGELGSVLTVAADPQYSQPFANALTVATWICPLALDNAHTGGSSDHYVHLLERGAILRKTSSGRCGCTTRRTPVAIHGCRFIHSPWVLPLLLSRGTAPTWSMASPRMMRRLSN